MSKKYKRPRDSFGTIKTLKIQNRDYKYFSLRELIDQGVISISNLPFSIKVLLESVVRAEDGDLVLADHVDALASYNPNEPTVSEVPYLPARVLLQDFTGVPAVVDLAAMRSAMDRFGGDPSLINPHIPVDLIVDHSIQVDAFASDEAYQINTSLEFERNKERYEFLKWGQHSLDNFEVIPPASGICHQVNLEYLAQVVRKRDLGDATYVFPDSLVGTDSHTTMIGGLGVLGWGVGGIEAEASMLGQPLFMLPPPVVGVRVSGELGPGVTATDLVLTATAILRKHGVVGKFVEFHGPGLSSLTVADRATVSNMAPEYGATIGYFPIDNQTLLYLKQTGRPSELVDLVERYAKEQDLFRTDETEPPEFTEMLDLDLGTVKPSLAGPKRPQDRISLSDMKSEWQKSLLASPKERGFGLSTSETGASYEVTLGNHEPTWVAHGAVAIAAITSCTNTSNPEVMLAAGLMAKNAVERGLKSKPWVKTSLAPGSTVVTEYLTRSGLMGYLEQLGFHLVGYGCTTCIGNSGPLPAPMARASEEGKLVLCGVLSGNRNFEGRINPHVRANYLASPPLVIAYALAGTVNIDLDSEPIGYDGSGEPVFLSDIWPSPASISEAVARAIDPKMFIEKYTGIETSNPEWNQIAIEKGKLFAWDKNSTYIQEPPFFKDMSLDYRPIQPIKDARAIALLGNSITTDHISPAGAIPKQGPAGLYLVENGVRSDQFNSFGSRRGNDRVMTRGTFANIRLKNELAPGTEGGFTTHWPSRSVTTIFEVAGKYIAEGTPTIVLAGQDYGMGSSRDWAAKGTRLLGIKAVIAVSFERIHRSNLVGMGVLPLQFSPGESAKQLGLTGEECFQIQVGDDLLPGQQIGVVAVGEESKETRFSTICRIDTPVEIEYYRNGGILETVIKQFLALGAEIDLC